MNADKRRKWCDNPANLEGRVLGTEYVWTIQFWQHMLDPVNYRLSVAGLFSIDCAPLLHCQPLSLTVKDYETGVYCAPAS